MNKKTSILSKIRKSIRKPGSSPSPKSPPAKTAESNRTGKKVVIFGAVVLVFAVIGLVTTLRFGISAVGDAINHTKEKAAFSTMILPLVMQDPPPFSSPSEATDTTIITAAVWRLIINEDISKYPADEFNFLSVPQGDIEVQIRELFGNVTYTHQTVGDSSFMINYDEENKTYIFPATPYIMSYSPEIQKIEKTENGYILTVGYLPPGLSWQGDLDGNAYQPEADKIMYYTVVRDADKNYTIQSISASHPLTQTE